MIAPKIQKQLVNACVVETTNVILADLGDRWFTLLLDEARDCSVKEQMTVVIRYMNKYGEMIERCMVVVHVATTTTACLKEIIDIILQEMDSRFSETTTDLLIYMSCLPRNSLLRFDVQKLVYLAHFYEDDFSWNERILVEQELETYINDVISDERLEGISYLGALAKKMIETMKNRVFPLVYRMIELALLLLVATATVERVFSAMNIIKTDLRNRIGDEWMNNNLRFQNMEFRRM
ncbi:uncharacterized protein LOC122034166 [Zingiber officinale]|uniref:uncharacterized protein LOC122034166 n=1 Tax=Zingiber officinale TaxID=94328 RepID=UPI001C4D41C3|nr:uncharacterized protein LOC122034166 [Zingiber officinale]